VRPALQKRNKSFVEFTIVESKKDSTVAPTNEAKTIVEQSEFRINDEKDPKAKFLSRYDQRVVDQTQAAKSGKFQNDGKTGPTIKETQSQKTVEETNNIKHSVPNLKPMEKKKSTGEEPQVKLADLEPRFSWEQSTPHSADPGLQSQTDDDLKGIQTGPQTLLSTREFVYYSYYMRIKDRLRHYWEPKIKEKVAKLINSGRRIATDEEQNTHLMITLDKNGNIIKVQVLGASGIEDLDDAAVEAFQAAAPFPNPPKGIIEASGVVRVKWDFSLEAHSSLFAPVSNVASN
jgi:protein TonB